jgi:hypothetical protein
MLPEILLYDLTLMELPINVKSNAETLLPTFSCDLKLTLDPRVAKVNMLIALPILLLDLNDRLDPNET